MAWGIPELRSAIAAHYRRRYDVELDPETEVVVTIGATEGIAHMMLALLDHGDSVIVPSPAYPIHSYAVDFAGGRVIDVPLQARSDGRLDGDALLAAIDQIVLSGSRPKAICLGFPANPTTLTADRHFFERLVDSCRKHQILLVHDFAYADYGFDEEPVSALQIPGARELGVEFFSMSKSFRMAGWRVGFCVGNAAMVQALTRIKSYLDYGPFQPIQLAAAHALREEENGSLDDTRELYRRRRDAFLATLESGGWSIPLPAATMFVWAPIPERFRALGSVEFSRLLLREADVVVSPGVGFGGRGDEHVRFALVQPEARLVEAAERISQALARLGI